MNVSVRISLARVRDVQTLDQGLIIDIKSKEVLQVIIGGVRSWKPQSQSLSSGLWILDFRLGYGTWIWDLDLVKDLDLGLRTWT